MSDYTPFKTYTMPSRYVSKCGACHGLIYIGEIINWTRGQKAKHVQCPPTHSFANCPALSETAVRRHYPRDSNGTLLLPPGMLVSFELASCPECRKYAGLQGLLPLGTVAADAPDYRNAKTVSFVPAGKYEFVGMDPAVGGAGVGLNERFVDLRKDPDGVKAAEYASVKNRVAAGTIKLGFKLDFDVLRAVEQIAVRNDAVLRQAADRMFRFLCGLDLRDHTVAEQREALAIIRAVKALLRPEALRPEAPPPETRPNATRPEGK